MEDTALKTNRQCLTADCADPHGLEQAFESLIHANGGQLGLLGPHLGVCPSATKVTPYPSIPFVYFVCLVVPKQKAGRDARLLKMAYRLVLTAYHSARCVGYFPSAVNFGSRYSALLSREASCM